MNGVDDDAVTGGERDASLIAQRGEDAIGHLGRVRCLRQTLQLGDAVLALAFDVASEMHGTRRAAD